MGLDLLFLVAILSEMLENVSRVKGEASSTLISLREHTIIFRSSKISPSFLAKLFLWSLSRFFLSSSLVATRPDVAHFLHRSLSQD